MTEIERKFLVNSEKFPRTGSNVVMKQGYLSVDPERVVRVRIEGDQAWITIKGRITGISRPEFEYPVPVADAEHMLLLALNPPVEKIRHRIESGGTYWEVDEFLGANLGLFLAEVELEEESQEFFRPDWLGQEVTADRRYYNSWLSVHPFTSWKG